MKVRTTGTLLCMLVAMLASSASMGVGTGGTGLKAYSRGAIASVTGRIAVNGVQWQAGSAAITINGRSGSAAADLRDGMVADVDGDLDAAPLKGTAQSITVNRVAVGIVARVGTGGTGLKAAGLVLAPAANVVVAGVPSLGDLADGDWVDVYGYTDGQSGEVRATRVERVTPAGATELHGTIMAVAPGQLVVNGVKVDVSSAILAGFGSGPMVGDRATVFGIAVDGAIVASEVQFDAAASPAEATSAEVEDAVEAVIDTGRFVLSDIEVDARAAQVFGGTLADIAAGRVLHVDGTLVNGVLVATQVGFDDDADGEVEGMIDAVTADGALVVGGVTIDPSGATVTGGSRRDLVPGRRVEVVGRRAGGVLHALRIAVEDAHGSAGDATAGGGTTAGAMSGGATNASGDDGNATRARDAGASSAEAEGAVREVQGPTRFRIGSVVVDASAARVTGGSLRDVKVGTRIHATGTLASGVLTATRVEIDD